MYYIYILLILGLFVSEGKAGKTEEGEPESKAASSPVVSRSSSLDEKGLERFQQKLEKKAKEQGAYGVPRCFRDFENLPGKESEWQTIVEGKGIKRWAVQSWKEAVGAHAFFCVALSFPHQGLLSNALGPLVQWASGDVSDLKGAYIQASLKVHQLVETHPYMQRRFSLYALAAAARLHHPLAGLVLMEALRCYKGHDSLFERGHTRVREALSRRKQDVLDFVGAVPPTKDLEGEDLTDTKKLKKKAQSGLPRYFVLLGNLIYKNGVAESGDVFDSDVVDRAMTECKKASDMGDYEGSLRVHSFICGQRDNKKASTHSLEDAPVYRGLAGWQGSERALNFVCVMNFMQDNGLPVSREGIFRKVKTFLVP